MQEGRPSRRGLLDQGLGEAGLGGLLGLQAFAEGGAEAGQVSHTLHDSELLGDRRYGDNCLSHVTHVHMLRTDPLVEFKKCVEKVR